MKLHTHSPLPWRQGTFAVADANGRPICHTGYGQRPPSESHESERNAEYIARAATNLPLVIAAARVLLATKPVFRSKPVGGEGSLARMEQRDQIEAEDALIQAIANAEKIGPEP